MSLLLEALRRAEAEAQKNKLTDALALALALTPDALATASQTTLKLDDPALIAAMTHRQAMSAAGVMAGSRQRKTPSAAQQRKWWLVVVALIAAFPVVVFLLFGDFFVASFRLLVAPTAPVVQIAPVSMPISPPVLLPAVATPDSAPIAGLVADALGPFTPLAAFAAPSPAPVPLPRPAAKETPPQRDTAETPRARMAAAAPTVSNLSVITSAAKPDALMASAYAAYQAGNPAEAGRLYREVLQADATQRDAWLGLAVIAHADNQREPALDAYKRVLRLEPQNATALAGIHSLSSQAGEPQQESRLRELLARSSEEPDLNNALGLVLSGAQRWSEAQPLFFKAHQLAPQEPRFAYNLAVTFDHLRRSSLARQYYEASLLLAQDRDAGFDESSARRRLAVLRASSTQRSSP